jgi:hypothetical protein
MHIPEDRADLSSLMRFGRISSASRTASVFRWPLVMQPKRITGQPGTARAEMCIKRRPRAPNRHRPP